MKYKKTYFWGGDQRDKEFDDWIKTYTAENGMVIEVNYGFSGCRWYEVGDKVFSHLKEAKAYCEKGEK